MKTQGEIAAAVCERMSRLEREFTGRGPRDISAYLIQDLLLVRLKGIMTQVEEHLATSITPGKGEDLLKQVRNELLIMAKPILVALVAELTGVEVLCLLHDLSMGTNEEIVIFVLNGVPQVRETKRKKEPAEGNNHR